MALGAFVTGWVVDHFGAQNGFWVSVMAGAATVLTVALGQRTLSGDRVSLQDGGVAVAAK
jgi:predicted MFS family arabinose efflux permease